MSLQPWEPSKCQGFMGAALMLPNSSTVYACSTDLAKFTFTNDISVTMVHNSMPHQLPVLQTERWHAIERTFNVSLNEFSHIFYQEPHSSEFFSGSERCAAECQLQRPNPLCKSPVNGTNPERRSFRMTSHLGETLESTLKKTLKKMGFSGRLIHVPSTFSTTLGRADDNSGSLAFDPIKTTLALNLTMCSCPSCGGRGGHQCMPGLPDVWAALLHAQYHFG